jgi:phosphatidylserine/phosphatidylglycerophosphate/cardiolipin synthase-like enzyme
MNTTFKEFLAAVALVASGFAAAKPFARAGDELRVETHYAPAENLEQIDVALIARATRTLDIAAYVLTDVPVIDALVDAGRRGVAVRVFRDGNERQATGPVAAALDRLAAAPNVEQRFKGSDVYMHLKSYCVDGRLLRSGAANFSASGLKRQENDLIVIDGAAACARFATTFEVMWRLK